jgi:hypothetical protein
MGYNGEHGTGKIAVIVDHYEHDDDEVTIMSPYAWVNNTNEHDLLDIDKARHGDVTAVVHSGNSTWIN